jgi:hypothetical protein
MLSNCRTGSTLNDGNRFTTEFPDAMKNKKTPNCICVYMLLYKYNIYINRKNNVMIITNIQRLGDNCASIFNISPIKIVYSYKLLHILVFRFCLCSHTDHRVFTWMRTRLNGILVRIEVYMCLYL